MVKQIWTKVFGKRFEPKKYSLAEIEQLREFDSYELDVTVSDAFDIHLSAKLPSEPPEGIHYHFEASGYIGSADADYCVILTKWKNENNYCHWTFSELPQLFLAFESGAKHLVLPDEYLDVKLPFQKAWMKLLFDRYPEAKVHRRSQKQFPKDALIPRNHDTSTNQTMIGKCPYRFYHQGRATPYLIRQIEQVYLPEFRKKRIDLKPLDRIYINRSHRRLVNELEVQAFLKSKDFTILNLEDYSLEEQVFIFDNAKVIMGFHGAGLTNLLFANKKSTVIELVDNDCVYPCYQDGLVIPGHKATRTYFHMLSVMRGLDYRVLESDQYHLPMETLERSLEEWLKISK